MAIELDSLVDEFADWDPSPLVAYLPLLSTKADLSLVPLRRMEYVGVARQD